MVRNMQHGYQACADTCRVLGSTITAGACVKTGQVMVLMQYDYIASFELWSYTPLHGGCMHISYQYIIISFAATSDDLL
jgi:hypothetical protein